MTNKDERNTNSEKTSPVSLHAFCDEKDKKATKTSKLKSPITAFELQSKIIESGLAPDDPRIQETMEKLNILPPSLLLEPGDMEQLISENLSLLHKVLSDEMVISNWWDFRRGIEEIFEEVREINSGKKASYIPALEQVDEKLFGVSVCTIDGQRIDLGDTSNMLCMQSCIKLVLYLTAVAECGTEFVHQYVGKEPSGLAFNSLALKDTQGGRKIPHNSMINAGAIMNCSLIKNKIGNTQESLELLLKNTARLGGVESVMWDSNVFESELNNCDRNLCLSYMMRESNSFPIKKENVEDVLNLYFKCCSISTNTRIASVFAATLANGGVCPLTCDPIFETCNVRNCLSQMLSCGMYDYSGEWAFCIGLPAKSGVSGLVIIVVPNKMGIAIFSPQLDLTGNSIKAVEFSRRLVERFSIHSLDSILSKGNKIDFFPKSMVETSKRRQHRRHIAMLLMAASKGDVNEIRRLIANRVDPFESGVDHRTALHLAASDGSESVVNFLLQYARLKKKSAWEIFKTDDFGNTALDDAQREGQTKIFKILQNFKSQFGVNN